ncbi:MAG TPA: GNAT family N-acetyltransferase [Candidatus Saccharimonadales bacterium]|jgi:GNAT superfamily N-acetyltransferase|nr:GNAT family N-acetyltransferase [Candidatus Saccharimonadales bacterium]
MLHITPVNSKQSVSQAQILFREYGSMPEIGVCVVDFDQEILSLPGVYALPTGRLLLAYEECENCEEAAGCVALRQWEQATKTCELKRLYVRIPFRRHGVGRKLIEAAIQEARSIGYRKIVLDTLPSMSEAHKLYKSAGFHEIPAYQKNLIPGALFFALKLS